MFHKKHVSLAKSILYTSSAQRKSYAIAGLTGAHALSSLCIEELVVTSGKKKPQNMALVGERRCVS